eukprot:GAFH01001961.1.p1 GENE.GAFH01001961.1~~GAFH01001961.1.p1  ORF type:complete len:407 (-),score=50.54 GAFH01001961.1:14-1234(-)
MPGPGHPSRVGAELPYALRVFSDRPYAIRPVPFEAAWQEATIEGEWAPLQAEGLPSSQGAWWENPQFLLSLLTQEGLPPTEVPVQVCLEPFYTHAIDPAGRYRLLPGLDAEGNHPTPYYYDLVCLPATPAAQEVEGDEGPADGPIYRTCTYKPLIPPTFTNAPENVRQLSLRAGGSAILMPTTYGARQYGRFRLTVLCPVGTPVALQLQPVPEWPHRTALWGAWTGPTAAGCPNSGTAFWRNPTFRLRLQGGRRARVVLCQHAPGDREAREGLARLSPAEGRALVPLAPRPTTPRGRGGRRARVAVDRAGSGRPPHTGDPLPAALVDQRGGCNPRRGGRARSGLPSDPVHLRPRAGRPLPPGGLFAVSPHTHRASMKVSRTSSHQGSTRPHSLPLLNFLLFRISAQ